MNLLGLNYNEVEITYTAGLAVVPPAIKVACAQIVHNAQATPALNVKGSKMDTLQMQYFSESLIDANVQCCSRPTSPKGSADHERSVSATGAAARAADVLLRAMGGRTVMLRMPAPAVPVDVTEQFGLATPSFRIFRWGLLYIAKRERL